MMRLEIFIYGFKSFSPNLTNVVENLPPNKTVMTLHVLSSLSGNVALTFSYFILWTTVEPEHISRIAEAGSLLPPPLPFCLSRVTINQESHS